MPGPYISLTLQSILTNLNVVWTVIISILYLGSRYGQPQAIGCLLIVASGVVSMLVELQTGKGLNEYITADGSTETTDALWYVIFILGTIPAGISNCYKEKVLKTHDVDVMYASLWSGFWQILWGLVLFPINWLRMPEPATINEPGQTWVYVRNTFTCFMGEAPTEEDEGSCTR